MATNDMDDYFIYDNRLASFNGPQAVTKRRASSAAQSRAPKALSWPHKSIKPADMAKAGFIFQPLPSNPDNVSCFLCNKALDGWEENDNPLEEHLRHSPECGWAITAAVEAELGEYPREDPRDALMLEARMATFADRWPNENRKGWSCKTKELVEAGWKYTPTMESDDMATCTYCQLALDDWGRSDNPWDEHYKRTPDCPFFSLISSKPAPKKAGQTKAARRSKASRLSIQSFADLASVEDVTADIDDSVLTAASNVTTASKGAKKTTKGKKAATTTRARKTRAKKDEAVEVPEDKDELEQEAALPPPPPTLTKARKRASDDVEDSADTNSEAPAPKKHATKARQARASSATEVSRADTGMLEATEPAKKPAARKTTRKASGTRKASATRGARAMSEESTVSAAPAEIPDDTELDRQLQADLDRPLTDDETVLADPETKMAAAVAAASRQKQDEMQTSNQDELLAQTATTDFAMFDPAPAQPTDVQIDIDLKTLEVDMDVDRKEDPEEIKVPKKGRKAGTARKVSKPSTTTTKKTKEPAAPVEQPQRRATQEAEEPDELAEANVSLGSNGTVMRKSVGRASLGSVGSNGSTKSTGKRGRPAKKSNLSQGAEVEPTAVPAVPVVPEPAVEHAPEPISEPAAESAAKTSAEPPTESVPEPEPEKVDAEPAPAPVVEVKRTSTGKRGRPPKKPKSLEVAPEEPAPVEAPTEASAESAAEPAPEPDKMDAEPTPAPVEEVKRTSTGKRGRPPKKPASLEVAPEEPAPVEAPAKAPAEEEPPLAQTKVQIVPAKKQDKASVFDTPKVARKPVPAPKDSPFAFRRVKPSIVPSGSQVLPVPPQTPRHRDSAVQSAQQATVSPSPSPQASDAENRPPSQPITAGGRSGPIPMAALPVRTTPVRQTSPYKGLSPSKQKIISGLQSTEPWKAVDLDLIFEEYFYDQESEGAADRYFAKNGELSDRERDMTVEEWIYHNAGQAERKLKYECESMVMAFERQGMKARETLEGLVVAE